MLQQTIKIDDLNSVQYRSSRIAHNFEFNISQLNALEQPQSDAASTRTGLLWSFGTAWRAYRTTIRLRKFLSRIKKLLPIENEKAYKLLHEVYVDIRDLNQTSKIEPKEGFPEFLRSSIIKLNQTLDEFETLLSRALFTDLKAEGFTDEEIQEMKDTFADWDDWDDDGMDVFYTPREEPQPNLAG